MKRLLAAAAIAIVVMLPAAPASSHENEPNVGSTLSPVPMDASPVGESNPLIAALAAGGIILVGAAGIYIYRVIKKGL